MKDVVIYEISILEWFDNKPSSAIRRKLTLDSAFLTDARLNHLSSSTKYMLIHLLLTSISKRNPPTILVNHQELTTIFNSKVKARQALENLQSLQLLTFNAKHRNETNQNVIKRNETNLHELKQSKKKAIVKEKDPLPVKELVTHYCDTWKTRYSAFPMINGRTSGQLKQLVKDFGLEKSKQIIDAYLRMTDSWFLTKRHDIPTLLANLNSISHFIETGKSISRTEILQFDKNQATYNLLKDIQENGI